MSLAFPHLVFLVNPEAREGRATRRLRGILARAPAWAASSRLVVVATLAGAERALRAMSPEEIPVAAGGDGTVNFVARAVRSVGRAGLPMAILPLGTGNAIAHALGVGDLRRALTALAEGHSVALDGLVTDHPGAPLALSSLSAGFEGAVLSGLAGGRGVARAAGLLADLPGALLRRGGIGLEAEGRTLLDPSEHYTEKLIAPSFVPETMRALELLKLFLTHPQGMGVVVDEFGGTEGIITMENVVEEILSGSAAREDATFYIEPLGNGKFLVSGNARLDDLTEHLGFQIDAEGIDTIGGFIFTRLGYVPSSGTKLEIPGLSITVRRAGRKRIEEVLLEKTTNAFEEAA